MHRGLFEFSNKNLLEYCYAWNLTFLIKSAQWHPDLPDYLNSYKKVFTRGEYQSYLDSLMGSTPEVRTIKNKSANFNYFNEWIPIVIQDSISSLNISNKLFDSNEGIYYIDIWATWCSSCLEEMANNFTLDSLLNSNGANRIYISIDNPRDKTRWENYIYENNIGGYHILASDILKEYLLQELYGFSEAKLKVPKYLWLKNGIVINEDAARPSQINKILNQLKKLMD